MAEIENEQVRSLLRVICLVFIITGFKYRSDCPAAPIIPVLLAVAGILDLILFVRNSWCNLISFLFKIVLIFVGYFWLNDVGDFNTEDPQAQNYCSEHLLTTTIWFNKFATICFFCLLIRYAILFASSLLYTNAGNRNSHKNQEVTPKHISRRRRTLIVIT